MRFDATVVVDSLDHWDAAGLKTLAAAVTRRPGHVVALFTAGNPALCVVAASPDLPVDAGAILRALVARFGGKGGGTRELAQGGGLSGAPSDLLNAAHLSIRSTLG
jgi:alanyl-tRNA synthetase